MLGKSDPLTKEEMSAAADRFFELYHVVSDRMPDASVEDVLRIMESVAKVAHKDRATQIKKEVDERFGFVKDTEKLNADS